MCCTYQAGTLTASKILLCTGATAVKLLADSAPDRKNLHARNRFIAAGMCTALMTLEKEVCDHVPIVLHERLHHEGRGGFIPPTPDGNFKWWADITFTHLVDHPSGANISSTPEGSFQGQCDVPQPFHYEMERGREVIFGDKANQFDFESYRLCWDSISLDGNFFITAYPASKNIYVATIWSFHPYKFLPVIGKYLIKMLEGELEDKYRERWCGIGRRRAKKEAITGLCVTGRILSKRLEMISGGIWRLGTVA